MTVARDRDPWLAVTGVALLLACCLADLVLHPKAALARLLLGR